jgi:putative heme-binding domain-containing protein
VVVKEKYYGVRGAWEKSIRDEAASYLPNATTAAVKKAPAMNEITSLKADVAAGKTVFAAKCMLCHAINKEGSDFGPALSEIGAKYPPEGLLKSIVEPSAGINFGYEGWELKMKDGSTLTGIIAGKTSSEIELKLPGGARKKVKTSDIQSKKELKTSMMTEGLYQSMSTQDMANLLGYLSSLKAK